MDSKETNLVNYFKLITTKFIEEYYVILFKGLVRIQEELNFIGLLHSGELIIRTFDFVELQINELLMKTIKEISEFTNEISLLTPQETNTIQTNFISDFSNLINGIMDERDKIIIKLGLEMPLMDYRNLILINTSNSIERELTLLNTVNRIKIKQKKSKTLLGFLKFIIPIIIPIFIAIILNYDKIKNFFK